MLNACWGGREREEESGIQFEERRSGMWRLKAFARAVCKFLTMAILTSDLRFKAETRAPFIG